MLTVPAGKEAVLMDGRVTTVILSNFESDRFAESVTLAVKSKDPSAVGVPEINPPADKVNPDGRLPPVTAQLYGVVPPLADRVWT